MKLFSTLFKNFLETVFKNCFKFSNFFWAFLVLFDFRPCCAIRFLLLLWTICSSAPIAPRHAASRHADRQWPTCSLCCIAYCLCIGYLNPPLLLPTAKARTLCVYIENSMNWNSNGKHSHHQMACKRHIFRLSTIESSSSRSSAIDF